MKENTMEQFRYFLSQTLSQKKLKNPLFSLRALAKSLDISPSHLSNIMTGRKLVSSKMAHKILTKLDVDPITAKRILLNITQQEKEFVFEESSDYQILKEDEFKLVSDWEHFAILSLAHLKDNKAHAKWIASRLSIPFSRALECFHRLKQLKLIKIENGHFRQTGRSLHTTNDVPSAAIRESHQQNLALASEKLKLVPVEFREFSTITFEFDRKKMKTVKKWIRQFKNDVSDFGCQGQPSDVYTLAIQFFPLTQPEMIKEKAQNELPVV